MNLIIILILFAIMASLAFGAYTLYKDNSKSRRTLNALRLRVALSVILLLLLAAGHYAGWVEGNAVKNVVPELNK